MRNRKEYRRHRKESQRSSRHGVILFVVLVVIMMLTLACYQFADLMVAEREATEMYGRRVAARAYADSGVQWVAAVLHSGDSFQKVDYYHNPELFQGRLMADVEAARGRGKFTILAPVENDTQFSSVRFGIMDESGKLNLNSILKIVEEFDDADERARDILLSIPSMTDEIADAILDWVDGDDDTREFGAETDDYYSSLPVPYEAKNGNLESLDELLMIRDITPELVYGLDKNRNGLIDPSEYSSENERAEGIEIGFHPLGWSAMLTVFSRESNLREDGSAKVDLNQDLLTELFDELEEEFDEEIAKFVVAYRMNGPNDMDAAGAAMDNSSVGRASESLSGDEQGAVEGAAQSVANEALNSAIDGDEPVTRAGMDLAGGANFEINSIYDLIDVEVDVEINGVSTTLSSPWTLADIASYLPDLLEICSTSGEKYLEGRINVNQTRAEVLEGILTGVLEEDETTNIAEIVDNIMDSRLIDESGQPIAQGMEDRVTTAWLVINGIVDLPLMRRLDRNLTTGGDVYRVYSVGHYDRGGPVARVEAVIDATQNPPKVVYQRDLSDLGRGYSPSQLGISEQ